MVLVVMTLFLGGKFVGKFVQNLAPQIICSGDHFKVYTFRNWRSFEFFSITQEMF